MVCERVRVLLESAIVLAVGTHRDQRERAGAPYILHPLRVGLSFRAEVVEALDALNRRAGEAYDDYLVQVERNPLAQRVKLAGLRDNLDESRIPEPSEDDRRLWQKYRSALSGCNGDPGGQVRQQVSDWKV